MSLKTSATLIKQLEKLQKCKKQLSVSSVKVRNQVLREAARLLIKNEPAILRANQLDFVRAQQAGVDLAFLDRLRLDPKRIRQIVTGIKQVAKLPDPVGEVVENQILKNGLKVRRIRSPIGVIFMIFESRPNVAIEAFSLAFKAGNVILLKGGKESAETTQIFYKILGQACQEAGLSKDVFWGITDPDRQITEFLLSQAKYIDVVVPRGGDGLIQFVTQTSRIPVIKNDRGLCHVYVHKDADLEMAAQIVLNAKVQRPGVCNATETLLIHCSIAEKFLEKTYRLLSPHDVEWRCCKTSYAILKSQNHKGHKVKKATAEDWNSEHLDLIINCRIVDSIDQAITHIENHGSKHSESILTKSPSVAKKFQNEIDAAVVYWNASTRFTDGFELGLGGELGISTQKLHVRGPVGLRELTSIRWVIDGKGQIRN